MFRWNATAGDRDIVTLPKAGEAIAERAPEGGLIRVAGAGHMGFMERASTYDEAIAAFADQVFAVPTKGSAAKL